MQVTEITEFDKKRVKIYLDGEYAFLLYKGELRKFGIKEGYEIPESSYREITDTLLPKRCKVRAMNLLQKKDYTIRQLSDKLREGMYPQEMIDQAIDYVKSYRYLDDERYARDYISYHMNTRSRNRIIQDLTSKGISRDCLIPIMDEMYSEEDEDLELKLVRELLTRKHYDPENMDYKEKQKIMAFLVRKGFSITLVRKAMGASDFDY